MRITLMCAVPFARMDGGPRCADGRGGQIYHQATPCFFVESASRFSIGVAASFLLEYSAEDIEISHLDYVLVTARMSGKAIGSTQNDFLLNPYSPLSINSRDRRLATYENVPLSVACSSDEVGLIELSWALKVDMRPDPIEVSQTVWVRSVAQADVEYAISTEEFDAWQLNELKASIS